MSFDIFLGSFKNGIQNEFPLAIAENAFGRFVDRREPECWVLVYPDGGRGDLYIDDEPMIAGFSVNRPPAHPAFWQGIFDILSSTTSVLFWAGSGCVVASKSVIPDLPQDLIDTVGTPTVVTRPEQILEIIERSD